MNFRAAVACCAGVGLLIASAWRLQIHCPLQLHPKVLPCSGPKVCCAVLPQLVQGLCSFFMHLITGDAVHILTELRTLPGRFFRLGLLMFRRFSLPVVGPIPFLSESLTCYPSIPEPLRWRGLCSCQLLKACGIYSTTVRRSMCSTVACAVTALVVRQRFCMHIADLSLGMLGGGC